MKKYHFHSSYFFLLTTTESLYTKPRFLSFSGQTYTTLDRRSLLKAFLILTNTISSHESCKNSIFHTKADKRPLTTLLQLEALFSTNKSPLPQHSQCAELLQEVTALCNYTMQQVAHFYSHQTHNSEYSLTGF